MRVGIIGCGLIGKKRAQAIGKTDVIVACCDTNENLSNNFGKQFNCTAYYNHKKLLLEAGCEVIVVAVVNKFACTIIMDAIENGQHVIAEKPLGRNNEESNLILEKLFAYRKNYNKFLVLKTGFNHRFHPAIWQAKQLLDNGTIGSLMYIRAKYGHGGRTGMEKEWRASKELCGGGELLDQGVHIIDLCSWFAGDIKKVLGVSKTKFWDMEVEDNAFIYMESIQGVDVQFHVSWTNWKNVFSFEIFGTKGYLNVNGLGGSYGSETLEIGKRKPEGGIPDIEFIEFSSEDISWTKEWENFTNSISANQEPIGSGFDGHNANQIINAVYNSSTEGKFIFI